MKYLQRSFLFPQDTLQHLCRTVLNEIIVFVNTFIHKTLIRRFAVLFYYYKIDFSVVFSPVKQTSIVKHNLCDNSYT